MSCNSGPIETDSDRLDIVRALAGITQKDITVYHSKGSFDAWLDNEFLESQGFDGPAVESALPVLGARTIDVQDLPKGTRLTLGESSYGLVSHQPDGSGFSRVFLEL